MSEKRKRSIIGELFYRIARADVRFWHNLFYYRHIHVIGKENIPPVGTPLIIASNHQNAVNDALAVEFAFSDRSVSIFTRADLFSKPIIGTILRSWHLLPAFRLGIDGNDTLGKNLEIFAEAGDTILDGNAVMLFPEAINQDKRWLGNFSEGYLRLAFDAAKRNEFKTDIKILPMINHYSDYFHFREDLLVKFGKPISLSDYYEQYKSKPRTVQHKLNAQIRNEIDSMMLNITDLDNYDAIDYLRVSYGCKYCTDCGGDADYLPDKLLSDKALFQELQLAKQTNPQEISEIYSDILKLKEVCTEYKILDSYFDRPFSLAKFIGKWLCLIVGFPLFVFSAIPNVFLMLAPMPITNKLKKGSSHGAMFIGGVRFGLNVLFVMPIVYSLFFITEGILWDWLYAAIHTLLLPIFGLFSWAYRNLFISQKRLWRFRSNKNKGLKPYVELRNKLFEKLDKILTKNTWKKE